MEPAKAGKWNLKVDAAFLSKWRDGVYEPRVYINGTLLENYNT